MSDPAIEHEPPEEVFGLLGNRLRVDILRALADGDPPVVFSTLRDKVEERDSGRFNYHLRKLVGTFVRETDAGYELTLAGRRVVGALVAGTYTADATLSETDIDDPCPECETAPITASYADDVARLACPHCEEWQIAFTFPPGTLAQYATDELPGALDRWLRTLFEQLTAGFCDNCAGRLDSEFVIDGDTPQLVWRCDRCGSQSRTAAATPFVFHPAVQGFLYDNGVDPTTTSSWRLLAAGNIDYDIDDGSVGVTYRAGGATIRGTVGTDGSVHSIERSDRKEYPSGYE